MPDLRKGYWVALLPMQRSDGTLGITFIARRTFTIPVDNAVIEAVADDAQPPFLEKDRFDEGDAMTAPPTLEQEFAPEKARTDVIVIGKAYAPGGKASPEFEAAVRIGPRMQKIRVVGPRKVIWVPPKKREGKLIPQPPRFGDPTPVKNVVLTLANAYGGHSRLIPDDETLRIQREVEAVMATEKKEADAKLAVAQAAQKAAEEKKKKDDAEKALFDELGKKGKRKEEKVKRGYGEEGFDEEGVRLWGASAAKDGTAVLDLEEFDKHQLADMAREERERQEAEELAAKAPPKSDKQLRKNAQGEWIEADDGVAILTDDVLAQELAASQAEQGAAQDELAKAAALRGREEVLQNEGTRVLDGWDTGQDADDDWTQKLRDGQVDGDKVENEARLKRIAEQKKFEDEKLKDFPELPCPTNPFGKGFLLSLHEVLVKRLELPLIEDPAAPLTPADLVQDVTALDKVPLPMGFSVWPRQARPRIDLAGPYPDELKDWDKKLAAQKRALDLKKPEDVATLRQLEKREKPAVMRPGWFNSAAPTMQWGTLQGDEELTLTNLTKDGTLFFKLPGKALEAELDRGRGVERKELPLDTLVIEPDARTVTMLWRTHFALANWDEMGTYPHLVGWVLDLDIQQKKDNDWAERLKKAQGDGTAVLDLAAMGLLEDEPYLQETAKEPGPEDDALDLQKMGMYRVIQDDDWVKVASDGTVDVTAEEKAKKAEEAYVAEKTAALHALEAADSKEAARRAEVGQAVAEGKPVPPKDGPPGKGGKPAAPAAPPAPPPPGPAPKAKPKAKAK